MKRIIPLKTNPTTSVEGKSLNEQQCKAIEDVEGYQAISSGAGTGKTSTLVARLQKIHAVNPTATVLMLSFSKAAAQELKERVGGISGVTISTIHSLSYHIIKSSGWSFTVDTSTDNQESAIASLISSRTKTTVAEVVRSLHTLKNVSRSTLRIRTKYLKQLKEKQKVTFDSMIVFAVKILRKHAGLRNYWQTRYDFVQVDEAQDLNPIQVELLRIVTTQSKNVCVAGDQRQQIYSFRGACGAMEEFSKVAKVHELTLNYRCNPKILALANRVMEEYEPLVSAKQTVSIPPVFFTARDARDEAKYVVDEIERLHAQGQRYNDMAVLYRSSGVTSEVIHELIERKVPFETKSPLLNKYAAKPWREIITLFKFMSNPTSTDALREILPLFYLKKDRISEVETMVSEQSNALLDILPLLARKAYHRDCIIELTTAIETAINFAPSAALSHVIKHGLNRYFGDAMILSVEKAIRELQEYQTVSAFLSHMQEVKENCEQAKLLASRAKDVLTLSTIHGAKGCEWQNVFLIGLADGVLPSSRDGADIEEEKRLLYVGITRAKHRLYLSYPRTGENTIENNKPCKFIAGLF